MKNYKNYRRYSKNNNHRVNWLKKRVMHELQRAYDKTYWFPKHNIKDPSKMSNDDWTKKENPDFKKYMTTQSGQKVLKDGMSKAHLNVALRYQKKREAKKQAMATRNQKAYYFKNTYGPKHHAKSFNDVNMSNFNRSFDKMKQNTINQAKARQQKKQNQNKGHGNNLKSHYSKADIKKRILKNRYGKFSHERNHDIDRPQSSMSNKEYKNRMKLYTQEALNGAQQKKAWDIAENKRKHMPKAAKEARNLQSAKDHPISVHNGIAHLSHRDPNTGQLKGPLAKMGNQMPAKTFWQRFLKFMITDMAKTNASIANNPLSAHISPKHITHFLARRKEHAKLSRNLFHARRANKKAKKLMKAHNLSHQSIKGYYRKLKDNNIAKNATPSDDNSNKIEHPSGKEKQLPSDSDDGPDM